MELHLPGAPTTRATSGIRTSPPLWWLRGNLAHTFATIQSTQLLKRRVFTGLRCIGRAHGQWCTSTLQCLASNAALHPRLLSGTCSLELRTIIGRYRPSEACMRATYSMPFLVRNGKSRKCRKTNSPLENMIPGVGECHRQGICQAVQQLRGYA